MSKLILTSKELQSWSLKGSRPVLHIALRRNYEKHQIIRFGFENTVKGSLISITHLTPIIGFIKSKKIQEFRSSLREGLFITYQKKRNDVEIMLEKMDGKEKRVALRKRAQ